MKIGDLQPRIATRAGDARPRADQGDHGAVILEAGGFSGK